MHEFYKQNVIWVKPDAKYITIWLHLYKILRQTQLILLEINIVSLGWWVTERDHETGSFWGSRKFCFLTWVLDNMGRLSKGNSLSQHAFLYANCTSIKSLKEGTKIILQSSRPYQNLHVHLICLPFNSYCYYFSFHFLFSFLPGEGGTGILHRIHFEVMRPIGHCTLIYTMWSYFSFIRFFHLLF